MPVAASKKCVAINAVAITPIITTKVVLEVAGLAGRSAQFGHAGFHMSVRQPNRDICKFWMGVLRRQQLHDLNLDLVELLQSVETVVRDLEDKRAAEVGREETETGDWK